MKHIRKSEDGDIIDCVEIYKQPSLNHPALKNHTIQLAPTFFSKTRKVFDDAKKEDIAMTITSQRWQKSGSCPKGTVPIRRTQKRNPNKDDFHAYGRKTASNMKNEVGDLKYTTNSTNSIANHSVALIETVGYSYSGAKVDIKVWTPYVEKEDEYSTSHVAIQNGGLHDFELVETGWAADGSKRTGCFDLTCPGFVQVNHEIALGGAIYPISNPNGLPYQITVYIFKDPTTKNWWVNYGESINIGYWPGELFMLLKYQGIMVKWGGEVYSSKVKTHPGHTATGMGSGNTPPSIFENCGTMKRMRVEQNSQPLMIPEWSTTVVDEYRCYGALYEVDYIPDPIFYYGGPGRSPWCP
ncbi:uncharacterized protein LOC112521763 [Cynara cardunculus var. scolymus]|uniref:uncharacterized protein LOC112521763 n=1 Tax=Cynara cardunculus var. scolymus TaxID=59895 RepID=UPI000D6264B4|nr:uncharacterized protein LOC112521763 [Cynara cardunculus var. scolymus]